MAKTEIRPPHAPWKPLADQGGGYLSVYYNELLARWPVREITRRADNKCDPNIETCTYGLFSTCEEKMRKGVVDKGASTIFFMTTRDKVRLLTGYYHIGWYASGVLGGRNGDYALAADTIRFVDPIDPRTLPEPARSVLQVRIRTFMPLGADLARQLRAEIDARESRTDAYRDEVARLEQFARAYSPGYAYPSWGRESGFSWEDAATYLSTEQASADHGSPTSSRSGRWRCADCEKVVANKALLKVCPACGAIGKLAPEPGADD